MHRGMFSVPERYFENKIVLMIKDPASLYTYWETTKEKENTTKNEIIGKGLTVKSKILRVVNISLEEKKSSSETAMTDHDINDFQDNWYISVNPSGGRWQTKVGLLCTDGEFFSLADSNIIEILRDNIPDEKRDKNRYPDIITSGLYNRR